MGYQAGAKLANVVGSVQAYINTHLATTFPSAIDFGGGMEFSDVSKAFWLQVRLLEPARPEEMIGPRAPKGVLDEDNPFGREMFHLINLNIFVRPKMLSPRNNLKLWQLRDVVVNKFMPVLSLIEVKNYTGDSASLGYLIVEALDADRPVPGDVGQEAELLQHNLVVSCRWHEFWDALTS